MDISLRKIFLIQCSACIAETGTYPIDYIKTRMQINSQKNNFSLCNELRRDPLRIYDGLKPALFRHCIYTMLRINIYEHLRNSSKDNNSMANKFMIGGLSGGLAQLVASPCDLIKIRYIIKSMITKF